MELDEQSRARLITASLFQHKKNPKKLINSLCEQFEVKQESIQIAAKAVVSNLKMNAEANGTINTTEKVRIDNYASQFGIEVDIKVSQNNTIHLFSGMKVCLTGSPPDQEAFKMLIKSELRKILTQHGLEELPNFTKKCELVVAFNKESMSRKAKKARELGIPVISSEEFLKLLGTLKAT
jgi:NAD-dependent DNA ligase